MVEQLCEYLSQIPALSVCDMRERVRKKEFDAICTPDKSTDQHCVENVPQMLHKPIDAKQFATPWAKKNGQQP